MEQGNGMLIEIFERVQRLESRVKELEDKLDKCEMELNNVKDLRRTPKSSSKYRPLTSYLRNQTSPEVEMSFDQIEDMVGEKLPESARTDRVFWANTETHAIPLAWMSAGYVMDKVDFENGKIHFCRYDSEKIRERAKKVLIRGGYIDPYDEK